MVRLKRFFGWKIKTQMLVSMMMLIFLTAAVLAVANWGISKGIIEENYRKTNESNLKSFNSILDYKLSVINELYGQKSTSRPSMMSWRKTAKAAESISAPGIPLTLNRMAQSLESQSTLIDAVFVFDNQDRYFQHFRGNFNSSEYMGAGIAKKMLQEKTGIRKLRQPREKNVILDMTSCCRKERRGILSPW